MSNNKVVFCNGAEFVSDWADVIFQYFLSLPDTVLVAKKIVLYPLSTLLRQYDFNENEEYSCKIVLIDYPLDWPVLFEKNNIEILKNNLRQMDVAIVADNYSASLLRLYTDIQVYVVGMPFESAILPCNGELELGGGKILILNSEVDDSFDYTDFVSRLCIDAGLRYEVLDECVQGSFREFMCSDRFARFSCAIIASGTSDICIPAAQLCAAGIPCVGSDNQVFLRELYPDNFFSLPFGFIQMKQQLVRLNGNPTYRQYIMEKARIQFSKKFSPHNFTAKISEILKYIKRG